MYGVVVMMALNTSAEAPDFFRNKNCNGCNGCSGTVVTHGCSGSSCHGCNGCNGCRGGGLFGKHRNRNCNGCSGGCSGTIYHGGCTGGCTGTMPKADPPPKKDPPKPKDGKSEAPLGNKATIVVTLPQAAPISIDDYQVGTSTDRHVFITAPLAEGESRTYTFKAVVTVDGKRETVTKQVSVTAGQEMNVSLVSAGGVAAR